MEEVSNELEALKLCKQYKMKIEFRSDMNFNREFVVVNLGFKTVAGKTLVEAINRLIELYKTEPIHREKLNWFEESQKYLHGVR